VSAEVATAPRTGPGSGEAPASGAPNTMGVLPVGQRVKQAGFVTRLVAFLIDIVLVTVGSIVFAALVGLVLNFFGFGTQSIKVDDRTLILLSILQAIIVVASGLAVLLFVPAYFVGFWVLSGATPGKFILGLQVVRTQHRPLGWRHAIVRYIGYFISAICLFMGFVWILVDGRRQGWHDKLADTFVVYTWDVPDPH
jgi:uncharacterized RDD family membrane protein YckC